jgi:TonB-dependent starch-binding outer membrane protein SusC
MLIAFKKKGSAPTLPSSFIYPVKGLKTLINQKLFEIMKKFLKLVCSIFKEHRKKIIIMRNTVFIILISAFQVFASGTYAQTKKITLKMKDATIKEVLYAIEKQSEFYFLFNSELIDVAKKVDIQVKEERVENILIRLFNRNKVDFMFRDRYIVLTPVGYRGETPIMINQPRTVSGKVTDSSGQPLPGVTIVVKGTTQGTVTDADGEYTITDLPDNATLVFSFVGMQTQELIVGNQTNIDVTMEEEVIGIEEVVAIGYGTTRKSDLTSAISSISEDDIAPRISSRIEESLQGLSAGVNITQASGVPGNAPLIRIRGVHSISGGNSPLFVVDGFPVEDNDVIGNLNLNDVQSIEVLKDAASSAIYGSRGSNGVVIITTKRGVIGKPQFQFNSYYGIQEPEKMIDFMSGKEEAGLYKEVRQHYWLEYAEQEGLDPSLSNDDRPNQYRVDPQWGTNDYPYYHDRQDELFTTGNVQNYSLSMRGGAGKTLYFGSLNYFGENGTFRGTGYDRFSGRVNIESQVHKRVKLGINFNSSYSIQDDRTTEGKENVVMRYCYNSHFVPDDWTLNPQTGSINSEFRNYWYSSYQGLDGALVAKIECPDMKRRTQILSNQFAEINILDGLDYKSLLALNYQSYDREVFYDQFAGAGIAQKHINNSWSTNWLWENLVTYNNSINKHDFNLLGGYTVQKNYFNGTNMSGRGFANELAPTMNNATELYGWGENVAEWSIISYLARATYNYDSRYLFTASIRRDGSSRFGKDNKWGIFPSLSGAWNISKESFWGSNDVFSNLKLRVSWGKTGNNQIGNYSHIASLRSANAVLGVDEKVYPGLMPASLGNSKLGWEVKTASDIGMEIGLLRGRLNLEFDYYYDVTSDLLLNVPIPITTGFTSQIKNLGEVLNQGIEIDMNSHNLVNEFKWSTSLNLSYNHNEVLKMGPEDAPIISGEWYAKCSYTGIGEAIGSFYMLEQEGIWQTDTEAEAGARWGNEGAGDVKFRDVNKDGKITNDDRTILGQPFPKWNIGFTNEFRYKNFDARVFLNGAAGHKTLWIYYRYVDLFTSSNAIFSKTANWNNAWRSPENPGDGKTPSPFSNNQVNGAGLINSRGLYDASWWRIKNVTIGYTVSGALTKNMGVDNARFYITGDNLFLGTKFPGYNPEGVNLRGENVITSAGYDMGVYPLSRKIVIGVNINF